MAGDRLTAEDTAEIERYNDWFVEVRTDEWARPPWFYETRPVPVMAPSGPPRRPRRYKGRHRYTWRHALRDKWYAALDWAYQFTVGV